MGNFFSSMCEISNTEEEWKKLVMILKTFGINHISLEPLTVIRQLQNGQTNLTRYTITTKVSTAWGQ